VEILFLVAPVATIALLPLAYLYEGPKLKETSFFIKDEVKLEFFAIVLGTSLLAFCLLFLELKLVKLTSSLTVSILGIFKEIMTIVASVFVFGDKLNSLNIVGVAVSAAGLMGYNTYRQFQANAQQRDGYKMVGLELLTAFAADKDEDENISGFHPPDL